MPADARRVARLRGRPLFLLLTLCALALAVRIAVALLLPSIIHQDETFQYLEQAHRLVFGSGLKPWEYVVGLRSWLFPGLIAGAMEIGRLFGAQPGGSLAAVAILMSILSLSVVVCGFLWGWRLGGSPAALAAGSLAGFWFEIVYFSGHTLSETLAADAMVGGLYLAYPGTEPASRWRLFWGGALLGLTATFRVQLGPALAVGVVAICGLALRRRYLPLLAGAILPVLLSGLLDWLTWDWPFQSIALNLWINVKQGVAAEFSKSPPYQYLSLAVTYWSGAFALIVALALWGGRRLPALLLVAVTIILTHSLLAHKEYRFVYPATPLIMILAGIGSAELAQRLWPDRRAALWGLPLFWIVTSLILARGREFYPLWFRDEGSIVAMRRIDADPAACGVAIYPADVWDRNGGYAHLRPGIPLYALPAGRAAEDAGPYDYIVAYRDADFAAAGFSRSQCWAEPPGRTIVTTPVCLWRRAGACSPGAAPLLTATAPEFLLRSHPEWFKEDAR
jgi:hypothetical protein